MPDRSLPDWINGYVEFTSNLESPGLFDWWTGISCLSAALNRSVWIDQQHFRVYPNLFVVLVAAPGVQHKSTAINVGKPFLDHVLDAPRIIEEKITPEGLLDVLRTNSNPASLTRPLESSVGFLFAGEFTNFINSRTSESIFTILCELYDCNKHWIYRTKSTGKTELNNIWFGFIGATTTQGFAEILTNTVMLGGFASRLTVVYTKDTGRPVPWVGPVNEKLREQLIQDLKIITAVPTGPFEVTTKAYDEYVRIYKRNFNLPKGERYDYARKMDTILKVAQLVCLSRGNEKTLWEKDIIMADFAVTNLEREARKVMSITPAGTQSYIARKIIERLDEVGKPGMTRTQIYNLIGRRVDLKSLQGAIDSLKWLGLITEKVERDRPGRPVIRYNIVPEEAKLLRHSDTGGLILPIREESETPVDEPPSTG